MIRRSGEPPETAACLMVLLHGRGASAADILLTAGPLATDGFAFVAPEAEGAAWYPQPFTAPLQQNEPWLSEALAAVGAAIGTTPTEQVVLLGFSQGACLALEYAARNPRRYGAVVGWSGALIGPAGAQAPRLGSLAGTPVFLGCSDVDPYVRLDLVQESARVLAGMGADVDLRVYPGMGHEVNADELDSVRQLMAEVIRPKEVA